MMSLHFLSLFTKKVTSRFFQAEKMAASRTGVVRCWRDVRAVLQVRVPNPAPLGYDEV